jgi:hypothetical protein
MRHVRSVLRSSLLVFVLIGADSAALADPAACVNETALDLHGFQKVTSQSGPANYYSVQSTDAGPVIHALYQPPMATTVLGHPVPEDRRRSVRAIRWRWRADVLPLGGDACVEGKGDSAAAVYVTWRRGLRWYTVKYVWSAVGQRGRTCNVKRNPFAAQDTVILESGPPLGQWKTVEVDPDLEFRRHFEGGDSHARVPDLMGVAIMTDGDQTKSQSEADYAGFSIIWK